MTKRKRPGAADLKKPAPAKQAETGTQMMAFRIPKPLANELRGAAKALEVDQASILRGSLERELARLRRKYNEGEPFPSVTTEKGHRSRRL
jgi:hypothetical protein